MKSPGCQLDLSRCFYQYIFIIQRNSGSIIIKTLISKKRQCTNCIWWTLLLLQFVYSFTLDSITGGRSEPGRRTGWPFQLEGRFDLKNMSLLYGLHRYGYGYGYGSGHNDSQTSRQEIISYLADQSAFRSQWVLCTFTHCVCPYLDIIYDETCSCKALWGQSEL